MVRFLSEEWIGELDRRLAPVEPTAEAVVVEQRVGAAVYHLTLGPHRVSAAPGPAVAPTIVIEQDADTGWEVFTARRSAEEAFVAGEIAASGDLLAAVRTFEVLARAAEAIADLASITER